MSKNDQSLMEGKLKQTPSLKRRLALADIRGAQHKPRAIAPASPYNPIRERATGPRDWKPKDPA